MERYDSSRELRERLDKARANGQRVGMIGTSGAMHRGHLSLIERAATDNDISVMFWGGGTVSDWMASEIAYERDANRDLALAESAGLDIIFTPDNQELFAREPITRVSLPAMSTGVPHLEDPAHLDLIALVMCKLWNIVGPCRCYFGEKDWQQLAMYQRLADDLAWPVEVIGCPTVRHADGLAISSRNAELTEHDRSFAPALYRALCLAQDAALDGVRASTQLEGIFGRALGRPDCIRYFTPVEASSMTPLTTLTGCIRLLASIELGAVRLLDNVGLQLPGAAPSTSEAH